MILNPADDWVLCNIEYPSETHLNDDFSAAGINIMDKGRFENPYEL